MFTRHGNDTVIGFIPGADIGYGSGVAKGGLTRARDAFTTFNGWLGVPAVGDYTYPSGGLSEDWDFSRAYGSGPSSWRSFAIPNLYTPADVHAGKCDAIWTARAKSMVAHGCGNGWYFPGYEGSDKNFSGSAGLIGDSEWAYAVSRQVTVMRAVVGWENWVGINYDVSMARAMGLNPDLAFASITVPFQSIDTELYPFDDWHGTYSAATSPDKVQTYALARLAAQQVYCKRYGVPLGIGEFGSMIRSDGHATNDDPTWPKFAHDYLADKSHNVSHLFIYNGSNLPGDNCRTAVFNAVTNTYTTASVFPKASASITEWLDPALFVTPDVPVAPADTLQTQIDSLTVQLASSTAALATATDALSASSARIAAIKSAVAAA